MLSDEVTRMNPLQIANTNDGLSRPELRKADMTKAFVTEKTPVACPGPSCESTC